MAADRAARAASLTGAYAAVQATFWMSYCVAVGFAAVYLQALGYSNAALGVILASGSLLGALLGPALCAQVDRYEKVTAARILPPVRAAQAATLAVLLLFPVRGAATSVSYAAYIALCATANSLNLKLYADAVYHGARVDYGVARGGGSFAYMLLAVALGVLAERVSARVIPAAGLVLCALELAAFLFFTRRLPKGPAASASGDRGMPLAAFLRANPRFSVLLAGTALLFCAHNVVGNFSINVVRNLGGDAGTMGLMNAFLAAVEIPVMLFYTRWFGKRPAASLLRASFVCFTLKLAAIAAAPSLPAAFAAFVLQAPSFALYSAAIVPYVSQTIRHEDSAKAQSLAFTMTTVGSVLASVGFGPLFDVMSTTATLWIATAVCTLGTAISLLGVARGGQKIERE